MAFPALVDWSPKLSHVHHAHFLLVTQPFLSIPVIVSPANMVDHRAFIFYTDVHWFKLILFVIQTFILHLVHMDLFFSKSSSCTHFAPFLQEDVLKYKDPASFKADLPHPYWICQPYVRPP